MVLTRSQERRLRQDQQEPVDSLPTDANGLSTPPPHRGILLADGRVIKSALKLRVSLADEADAFFSTPRDAGIKKHVRIHSRDNLVHLFERSQATEDDWDGEADGETFSSRQTLDSTVILGALISLAPALLALLGWVISSSWLIFCMKDLMVSKGLPFPIMLPAVSQLGSAAIVWALGAAGAMDIRPWPAPTEAMRRLLPMAVATSLSMYLGNYAYLGLSVSFLSILKNCTPVVLLVLEALSGTETMNSTTFLSTILIAYGTTVATVQETANNAHFQWLAFISLLLSMVAEGLRMIFAARLLRGMDPPYSPLEVMAHVGPMMFVLSGAAAAVSEAEGMAAVGWGRVVELAPELGVMCVLSFLVNSLSYLSLKYTSGTTVKVVGEWQLPVLPVAKGCILGIVCRRVIVALWLYTYLILLFVCAQGVSRTWRWCGLVCCLGMW